MGFKLRRWLADRLPAGLSPGERSVALEIADWANDKTGIGYGAMALEIVVRRTGLADAKQVGKMLAKLSAHGIELRVQVGTDKNGRAVYAYRGHQTTYRVPTADEAGLPADPPPGVIWQKDPRLGELSEAGDEPGDPSRDDVSDAAPVDMAPRSGDHTVEKGPPTDPERSPADGRKVPQKQRKVPQAGDPSPHLSSRTSPHPSPRDSPPADCLPIEEDEPHFDLSKEPLPQQLFFRLGARRNEAEMLTFMKERKHKPDTPRWWQKVHDNGDMAQWLASYRRINEESL